MGGIRFLNYSFFSILILSFFISSCDDDDEIVITYSPDDFVVEVFSTDCFTNFNTSTCPESNVTVIIVSGKVEGPIGTSFGVFTDGPVEKYELASTWTPDGVFYKRGENDAFSGQFDYIAQLSCIPADSLYGPVDVAVRVFAPGDQVTPDGGVKVLETQAICD